MLQRFNNRLVFAFGAISISLGVFLAVQAPTTRYELSIYAESPLLVWILLAIAFTSATILVFSYRDMIHYKGVVLAILVAGVTAGLPILRSYHYYGNRDALVHLGLVKSYLQGTMLGESIIYPLTHVLSAMVVRIIDISPRIALMLLIPLFVMVYVMSTYLLTKWLTGSRKGASVGLLTGCFLLPLVSVRLPALYPIPNTLGVFYFIFIIFLGHRAMQSNRRLEWVVMLGTVFTAAVFLHPLLAIALIAVHFMMALANKQIGFKQNVTLRAAFSLWALLWITRFGYRIEYFVALWTFNISGLGGDVGAAGGSLRRVGISLPELALRLAGVKLVFITLSIGLGFWLLYLFLSSSLSIYGRKQLVLAISVIPLGMAVAIFFALGLSNQWSRFLGFLLAMSTILGSVAIFYLNNRFFTTRRTQITALTVAVLLMTAPAALVVHPSPFLIRPNQQVTATQTVGYGHAFSTQSEQIKVAGLYTGPRNFRQSHYGTLETKRGRELQTNFESVTNTRPPSNLSESHRTAYPETTYVIVTETGIRVHLELFQSEVQTREDLESLDQSSGIDRIYDNGGLRQYIFY